MFQGHHEYYQDIYDECKLCYELYEFLKTTKRSSRCTLVVDRTMRKVHRSNSLELRKTTHSHRAPKSKLMSKKLVQLKKS